MLGLLPFHALAITLLKYGIGLDKYRYLSFLLSAWKEILMVFIGFLILIELIKTNWDNFNFIKNIKELESGFLAIIVYIILGLSSYYWARPEHGLSQFIWGFRYDFLFLIAFIFFSLHYFTKEQIRKLIDTSLYSASIVIILGFLIHFIGAENLTSIGFRNDWSTWYPNQALAYCQRLENSNFCRLSSTFGGPNVYGAYLIIILPLLFWKALGSKSKIWYSISTLGFISLILTFSRSAWISFAVELSIFSLLFIYSKNKVKFNLKKLLAVITTTIVFISLLVFINFDKISKQIIRPESTSKHIEGLFEGLSIIKEHPFGIGLGMAGPTSYKYSQTVDDAIIPENWYLQIGIENGLIAIVLFIFILYQIILPNLKNFLKEKEFDQNTFLTFSLIGISFCGLMVHSFEDASTVFTLFTLLGISEKKY